MSEFIIYEKQGHVAYLTLNRPEVLNALHAPANAECARAVDAFESDADAWVLVVRGAGERAFSAGLDLRYRPPEGQAPPPVPAGFGGLTNPRYRKSAKPVVAAVHGYALGGGCELALACDIVIAADNARFGLPEANRGRMAGAGGVHRLPRQIPLKIAMGYMLTGEAMTAEEAHKWGLVNEVVPVAELNEAVDRWVTKIVKAAPLSVRAIKEAAMQGLELPLEEAYNAPFPGAQAMRSSNDYKEGAAAFAERRTPEWTGT